MPIGLELSRKQEGKRKMDFTNIGFKEIMSIDSLLVLAGTVATLHAAATISSIEDYRYAKRCKKAGVAIKVEKRTASNMNKKGTMDKAEYRLKLAMRGGLRERTARPGFQLHIVK